jgi:hypothetical protein
VIPRTRIPIEIEPPLKASLPEVAHGRTLVIDASISCRCGPRVGTLSVGWRANVPGSSFVELAPLEGVRLFANRRLLGILSRAGVVVRRGGLPFGHGIRLDLERPELWIDYLDHPASFRFEDA